MLGGGGGRETLHVKDINIKEKVKKKIPTHTETSKYNSGLVTSLLDLLKFDSLREIKIQEEEEERGKAKKKNTRFSQWNRFCKFL